MIPIMSPNPNDAPHHQPKMRRGAAARILTLLLGLGLGLDASSAFAVDGVIEINQTSVLAGGITPSDSPGYPATIDTSGSYRLTSDLSLPSTSGVRGIEIVGGPVTIDLNGFTVLGPGSCAGIPPSCSGAFGTVGIEISTSQPVRIEGGTLTGLLTAINVTNTSGSDTRSAVLEDLAIEANSGTAVFLSGSGSSVIRNCQINRNGLLGVDIDLLHPSLIEGVSFRSNGITAIDSQGSATLVRNSEFIGNPTGIRSFFLSNPSSALIYGNNHFYGNSTNVTGGTQMGLNICTTSPCP